MFHQIYLAPEDRGALYYLWWPNGDITKDPKTHQMLVHIFGAKSLPSALRKTAQVNKQDFSQEVVEAAFRDFYVDDLLKSILDSDRAIELVSSRKSYFQEEASKWISNSHSVLAAFPVEERAPHIKNLDLKSETLLMDRALGIDWNVEHDTSNFFTSNKKQSEAPQRCLLSQPYTTHSN